MLEARISALKARLSSYIARVRRGETVLVLDRQTPVARLVPIDPSVGPTVREPRTAAEDLRKRPSRLKLAQPVDVVELLRHDRDEP